MISIELNGLGSLSYDSALSIEFETSQDKRGNDKGERNDKFEQE